MKWNKFPNEKPKIEQDLLVIAREDSCLEDDEGHQVSYGSFCDYYYVCAYWDGIRFYVDFNGRRLDNENIVCWAELPISMPRKIISAYEEKA